MTHEYTLLVGGIVLPRGGEPTVTAIAWAADTVLALGGDDEVRAISRGDSHVVDLGGAFVIPVGPDGEVRWPVDAKLEVGGPADLAVLRLDPRVTAGVQALALIRGGRLVAGALPGDGWQITEVT